MKVGLFKDNRSVALAELAKTLNAAGMETETFTAADAAKGNIYGYDVLFFGGGWNVYDWLDLDGRMHVVEFVQNRGGGVIFSMFRCGWAGRSGIRPIFPEIAWGYNKSNVEGSIMVATNHPIAKGLPKEFMTPGTDHAVMRLGPEGEIIARDSNDDILIACGDVGKGRVVFLGPWIGLDQEGKEASPLPANDKQLLLNSIGWTTANACKSAGGGTNISAEVRLKVLRREKVLDWTHDEKGISWYVGILAEAMYPIEEKLDSLMIRAERLSPFIDETESAQRLLEVQKGVLELHARLKQSYAQAKKQKIDAILKMSIPELEREPVRDLSILKNKAAVAAYGKQAEACREQLLPACLVAPVEAEVISLEKMLASNIQKAAGKEIAEEGRRDAAAVPGLMAELQSRDAKPREDAALELGRIGDKRALDALIKALEDKEYPVRRNAIYALGWMQAKEAVSSLLELAENTPDIRTKRRAVEALGLIGDAAAADLLLKALEAPDRFVRQNAILSLGWLGDKQAVGPLKKILAAPLDEVGRVRGPVYEQDSEGGWTREDMICAIRALGHIGDRSATPVISEFHRKHREEESGNLYFTSLSVDDAVELALKEIEQGGREERGVSQPGFLSLSGNFYGLTRRYNAFYGRPFCYPRLPRDWRMTADYASAGGGAGFIEHGTLNLIQKGDRGKKHMVAPPIVDEWLDYLSERDLTFLPGWYRRGTAVLDKAGFERDVLQWGGHPALKGFWSEETLWWSEELRSDEAFREYLIQKYKANELAGFGIKDIAGVKCPPSTDEGRKQQFLWAEYMEYIADKGVEVWQESAEWLTALRKGTYLAYNLSSRYRSGHATYISAYPRVTQAIGVNGPQTYSEHSFVNNFDLEMHVDGEVRPVIGEWYAFMANTPARVERGFASSFLHGQFFFESWWGSIFKHAPSVNGGCGTWEQGRWEAAERQFRKGKALSDYLTPVETPKLIAQLYSGRTASLSYGKGSPDGTGSKTHRYTQNQQGIWEALMQLHLPVDILWLETLTPEKMDRYKVAVLSDARSLSPRDAQLLKDWVKNGGVLISSGSASLHDQWDTTLANYALSDVFGADYEKTEMQNQEDFRRFLRRYKRPAKVDKLKLVAEEYTKHAQGKATAEYEQAIGYDVIKPAKGKTIAAWEDGSPAIVENKYGKGLSIFLSPIYPGLSHKMIDVTVDPLYLEFWDGAKELIGATVRRGLEFAHAELPMEVANCPYYVEAVLKIQEKQKRIMIHLLNMDSRVNLIENVEVKLNLPGKSITEAYYPYPQRKAVKYVREGDSVKFIIRGFDTHEMVVVEWKRAVVGN
ncbi:MAG: HEAT repeat domain-containing protein [Kiritimatiellae bacterium]|nr:HEAT repeat domain-containing protein [Kiritimatiellia bacterium]